jgi:hypothetical protein
MPKLESVIPINFGSNEDRKESRRQNGRGGNRFRKNRDRPPSNRGERDSRGRSGEQRQSRGFSRKRRFGFRR